VASYLVAHPHTPRPKRHTLAVNFRFSRKGVVTDFSLEFNNSAYGIITSLLNDFIVNGSVIHPHVKGKCLVLPAYPDSTDSGQVLAVNVHVRVKDRGFLARF
jgi:hypothetical protein